MHFRFLSSNSPKFNLGSSPFIYKRGIANYQRRLLVGVMLTAAAVIAPANVRSEDQTTPASDPPKKAVRARIVDDSPTASPEPLPLAQPTPFTSSGAKQEPTLAPRELAVPPEEPLPAKGSPTPAKRLPTLAKPGIPPTRGEPTPAGRKPQTSKTREPEKTVEPATATEFPKRRSNTAKSATRVEPIPTATNDAAKPRDAAPSTTEDVFPASFQDVTPGESTVAQAQQAFGKPTRETKGKGTVTYTFKVAPFPQVLVIAKDDVVSSLQILLADPTPAKEVAAELEITEFIPTPLTDATGQTRGHLYPERGVTLRFASGGKTQNVSTIILENTSAEHFLTRVQNDRQHRYQQNLSDLRIAQELAQDDARPYWLRAKILAAVGQPRDALVAINEALRLDPQSGRYLLTKAMLLAETGQFARAVKETRTVLDKKNLSPETRAIGEYQLGMLVSSWPIRDYKEATEHHSVAIQSATTLIADTSPETRRIAKEVLFDAHLAMASNVAWGNWKSKKEVTSRWLMNAEAIVKDLIENDDGDPALRMRLHRTLLGVYVVLGGEITNASNQAIDLGRQLIADATDPLYKQQMEWELGDTLCHAMSAARAQGRYDEALTYANNALALVESSVEEREQNIALHSFLGTLYFTVGSIHAVGKNDHLAAVRWYDKAIPHFEEISPDSPLVEVSQQGERLVSMGVSYWQTGNQELGLNLTNHGAQWTERAVKAGAVPEKALAIPYGNLASMHKQVGNNEESRSFASLAAKLETPAKEAKPK